MICVHIRLYFILFFLQPFHLHHLFLCMHVRTFLGKEGGRGGEEEREGRRERGREKERERELAGMFAYVRVLSCVTINLLQLAHISAQV